MMFWSELWLGGGGAVYLTAGTDIDIVVEEQPVDAGGGDDVLTVADDVIDIDAGLDVTIVDDEQVDVT